MAERLLDALPKVAMVALVDEATGYQALRAHNELQTILSAYILPEHRPWTQKVPVEFTKEIYRVYGWNYTPDNRGPRYASKLIRNLLYKPLPAPVLPELDRVNPPNEKWQRKRRHHQHLTPETGLEHFKGQLSGVMALLRATPSNNKEFFGSCIIARMADSKT
ncbi:P63C domain-containing protein [Methylorubrum suomiense]